MRESGHKGNRIAAILCGWFGPDAGRPGGPSAYVEFEQDSMGHWYARPVGIDTEGSKRRCRAA